ncbi:hypothetical protein BP5796_09810 [Coleophoma crateriformis]|uniref:Uncharacterized protein n=1 Tax=Coleophoma crateriformis TaxID=565419 RepID=A0A3D8QZG9_9HELO|nr:hypothetical protein BP5796_09810 [Coleophoma crateriformis]
MLCGAMWGLSRFERPAWGTGCLIPVARIAAAARGCMIWLEGKKVKKIEGVPVSEEDLEILRGMREHDTLRSAGKIGEVTQLRLFGGSHDVAMNSGQHLFHWNEPKQECANGKSV